jgi:hypothetical protein
MMANKLADWQGARYHGQPKGHYESWFLRGNHPTRNEAFWIRYTIFSPRDRPQAAIGELWVIYSNGETKQIRVAKQEIPIARCQFADHGLNVRIGEATLASGELRGEASAPHRIRWQLSYRGGGAPMLLLPKYLYAAPLPKSKALSTRPHVIFSGTLEVDGEVIEISDWVGSENHNWGSKHNDSYAWGQVVGFDNDPEAFLECATAKLKFGPLWTPPLTVVCLRTEGQDFRWNSLVQSVAAKGVWKFFDWTFDSEQHGLRISGRFSATNQDFVGLTYYNPPGGSHTCLNSKIASCEITLQRPGQPPRTLHTKYRAAFEILTDETNHGIPKAT